MTKLKIFSMYNVLNDRKWEWIYIILLAFFSFRKIFYGIDLWDTAYNYCNFENFEKIGIDSMWQFATYIPNLVGHFFTKFPFGDTLLGMNFYTTMIIFFLEILAFLFFARGRVKPWENAFWQDFDSKRMTREEKREFRNRTG